VLSAVAIAAQGVNPCAVVASGLVMVWARRKDQHQQSGRISAETSGNGPATYRRCKLVHASDVDEQHAEGSIHV
jgi:hypothetical protein